MNRPDPTRARRQAEWRKRRDARAAMADKLLADMQRILAARTKQAMMEIVQAALSAVENGGRYG